MSHADLRLALGAYVLGALEPGERAELAAHLEDCARCRAEVAEFAPLPGLLGRLSPAEARSTEAASVPDRPLRGALAEVAARRRARRWRLVAAAAVVAILTGVGAGLALSQHDDGARGVTVSATDPATRVHASAKLEDGTSGTTIVLTMQGVRSGERCRLIAVARDGRRDVAGSWRASYVGDVSFDGSTAINRADLARLDVVTFAGRTLVTIPVT